MYGYEYSVWLEQVYICSIHVYKYVGLMCNIWRCMDEYIHICTHERIYTCIHLCNCECILMCVAEHATYTFTRFENIWERTGMYIQAHLGTVGGCVLTE